MTTPPTPPPGWYPDPSGAPGQRYWDGNNWSAAAAPVGPSNAPLGAGAVGSAPAPKPGMSKGMKIGLGVGGAVIALAAIGSIGDSGSKKSDSSSSPARASSSSIAQAPAAPKTKTAAAPGSSVRDGKFEFTVLGIERAATKEGMFKPEQAKGEFITVTLRVTNVGDDARSFFASNQHLIINGNKYDATSSLSDKAWMEDINPGLSIEAPVTFDVPPGAVPQAIECHDSAFSGGALLGL